MIIDISTRGLVRTRQGWTEDHDGTTSALCGLGCTLLTRLRKGRTRPIDRVTPESVGSADMKVPACKGHPGNGSGGK